MKKLSWYEHQRATDYLYNKREPSLGKKNKMQ